MKSFRSLAILLSFSVGLAACGGGRNTFKPIPTGAESQASVKDTVGTRASQRMLATLSGSAPGSTVEQSGQNITLSGSGSATSASTDPVSLPSSVPDGHMLLTIGGADALNGQLTSYLNMTQIQFANGPTDGARAAYKIVAGDGYAPYAGQTTQASTWMVASAFDISGAATTNTVNASAIADVSAVASTWKAPTITTTVPNTLAFAAWVFEDTNGISGATVSNGWTIQRVVVSGGAAANWPIKMYIATKQVPSASSESPVLTLTGAPNVGATAEVTDLAIAPASTQYIQPARTSTFPTGPFSTQASNIISNPVTVANSATLISSILQGNNYSLNSIHISTHALRDASGNVLKTDGQTVTYSASNSDPFYTIHCRYL